MIKSPCKGCENRCIGCHSVCSKYAEFKQEMDEQSRKRREIVDATDYSFEAVQRMRAHRGQGRNPVLKGHKK